MENILPTRAPGVLLLPRVFRARRRRGIFRAAWSWSLSGRSACLASLLGAACFPRDDLATYSRGERGAPGGAPSDSSDDAVSGAGARGGAAAGGAPSQEGLGPSTMIDPGTGSADDSARPDCASECQSPDASQPPRSDASAPVASDAGADAGEPLPPGCGPDERGGPSGHCYVPVATALSWDAARTACLARGSGWDLASVRSRADNDFVASLRAADAWLGGTDAALEGTWAWATDGLSFWQGEGAAGTPLNGAFVNWFDDEPNGSDGSDCLRMLADGRWADLECDEARGYVCEGPPG